MKKLNQILGLFYRRRRPRADKGLSAGLNMMKTMAIQEGYDFVASTRRYLDESAGVGAEPLHREHLERWSAEYLATYEPLYLSLLEKQR